MNRCPITLEDCGKEKYSKAGLKLLSNKLKDLKDFPYTKAEQLQQAALYATMISIAGVQPKLSVKLNIKHEQFDIVAKGGTYIIKPPHLIFPELVENEDISMRLAKLMGIEIPLCGMIYAKDGSLSYFIRRFDRIGKTKLAVEDFAQLLEKSRDTKYNSSIEQVALAIEKYCTFPLIEKIKLFRLVLFSYLIGNEDMHLKNFSIIRRHNKIELSPAYDLINSFILLKTNEELALPIMGKRSHLHYRQLVDYFAKERLGLSNAVIKDILNIFYTLINVSEIWLEKSFLSASMKEKYFETIKIRHENLFHKKT